MPRPLTPFLPILAVCLSAFSAATLPAAGEADPVILSFAVTGDTRLDPTRPMALASALPADILREYNKPGGAKDPYPFYFNMVQVRQTFRDLARINNPAPKYLFLTGDLVMGFARDDHDQTLDRQLADFSKVVQAAGPKAPELVLMPGNHEMTFKEYNTETKVTTTGDDDADNMAWNNWVHANGFDHHGGNGPGKDALQDLEGGGRLKYDQSHLTYSFDDGPVHFVIMNTDTDTTEMTDEGLGTEGLIALKWVKQDLERAQANAAIKHIFVLGHRPVLFPAVQGAPEAGPDDTLNKEVKDGLRSVLQANGKVRALLVSHVHLFHADTLAPSGDASTRPVQIVAGNGGMLPEAYWKPEGGPYFGFTLLKVHQSGRVTYHSWQRPVPSPYYAGYPDEATAQAKPQGKATEIR